MDPYFLQGLDTTLRIAVAGGVFLFVVPSLLWPAPRGTPLVERVFWSLALGIVVLTGVGQLLCLPNAYSLPTLGLALLAVGLAIRWRRSGERPGPLLSRARDLFVVSLLNLVDGRVNVRRRLRRRFRRLRLRLAEAARTPDAVAWASAWALLGAVALGLRAYRPFASLDLGLSDSYVHLYWLKLLEIGRQVDPSWGPYPRGLHFVLLAIRSLTNVDAVLLVNFFGAFVGTLMVAATAWLAFRVSGSRLAALAAGGLFATFVGGEGQYFALGGRFLLDHVRWTGLREAAFLGHDFVWLPESVRDGGYDLAFWVFQRQAATLPQELAVCLLIPAGLFLHRFLEERRGWDLAGYGLSSAAIGATHPGVGLPLAVIVTACVVAAFATRHLTKEAFRRFTVVSLVAGSAGFSWALAFAVYPRTGGWISFAPFLDRLFASRDGGRDRSDTIAEIEVITTTTVAILVLLAASAVFVVACVAFRRLPLRGTRLMASLALGALLLVQLSENARLPALIHPDRNCVWLLMIGIAVTSAAVIGPLARVGLLLPARFRPHAAAALLAAGFGAWVAHSEGLRPGFFDEKLVDFTEHGAAPRALLSIVSRFDPYSWTVVTYGQEFPHVLGKGYHLDASDFLKRFDPFAPHVLVPTRHVLILAEKQPHPFEINAWRDEGSRAEIQGRLRAWCVLYQRSHGDMKVAWEDEDVQILMIERTTKELAAIAKALEMR